jgi:plastocyanin
MFLSTSGARIRRAQDLPTGEAMKPPNSNLLAAGFFVLMTIAPAFGAQWHATVGAQSQDKARQALAFLPNEIWIHAGDSIAWTFKADDIHTVTFLTDGQVRPPFPVGCPGFSASGATFDGSTCVTSHHLSRDRHLP